VTYQAWRRDPQVALRYRSDLRSWQRRDALCLDAQTDMCYTVRGLGPWLNEGPAGFRAAGMASAEEIASPETI
jgi:hypothetical protein